MSFVKTYEQFLNEKKINEDHVADRESMIEFIYDNARVAGYPDLENMDMLLTFDMVAIKNFYKMIEWFLRYNDGRDSSDMPVSEDIYVNEAKKSEHDGWLVIGLDPKTKKFEVLSIPLVRKEATRFLQSFEVQMTKMADHVKKYKKLKLAHASDVFEGANFVVDSIKYEIDIFEAFNWEDYDDTDFAASSIEQTIEDTLTDISLSLISEVPKKDERKAWNEVKSLINTKLKQFKH